MHLLNEVNLKGAQECGYSTQKVGISAFWRRPSELFLPAFLGELKSLHSLNMRIEQHTVYVSVDCILPVCL